MPSIDDLSETIANHSDSISMSEILTIHPDFARRTVQRWITQLLEDEKIQVLGKGRARRYLAKAESSTNTVEFPSSIPQSADSSDILEYIQRPLEGRKPVGYQREFLEQYQPNKTWYLPASLRLQLHKMGDTQQASLPAGTYGRAILNRLLIDLSWASSHLEGNTYTRLDTRELIEHGTVAQGKGAIETQMILNHKSAIELLVDNVDSVEFNRFTILNLHSALAENLLPNPSDEGRVRQHAVEIGKSVFRPLSVPSQINEMLDVLLKKAQQIEDPSSTTPFCLY